MIRHAAGMAAKQGATAMASEKGIGSVLELNLDVLRDCLTQFKRALSQTGEAAERTFTDAINHCREVGLGQLKSRKNITAEEQAAYDEIVGTLRNCAKEGCDLSKAFLKELGVEVGHTKTC
jgi:hypothetical protein